MKDQPTIAVGDAVVLTLDNGDQQSAVVIEFSLDSSRRHRYAKFAWKTGPRPSDVLFMSLHSCKWADRIVAVFPKDAKFLAVA
jgi:hypothetical protein